MTQILQYLGIGAVAILAIYGLWIQARLLFGKEKRDIVSANYNEWTQTTTLLKNKLNLQQEEINSLKAKMECLEEKNKELMNDYIIQSDRANRYFSLFSNNCPHQLLRDGKAYCDYFHPYDIKHMKDDIIASIMEDMNESECSSTIKVAE